MFDRYFNLSISTQTPHRLKSMRDWKNRRPQEVYLYSQGAACQPNSGCEDCLRMFEIVLSFEGKSKHGVPLLFCIHIRMCDIYIYIDILCMILYLYVMVMVYTYTVPGTVPYTYIDIDLHTKVHNKSVQFQTWSFMFSCQAGLDATCLAVMNASRTLRRFGRHVRAVEHGDGGADSGVLDVLVTCDCD